MQFAVEQRSSNCIPRGPRAAGFPPSLYLGDRCEDLSIAVIVKLITWGNRNPGQDLIIPAVQNIQFLGCSLGSTAQLVYMLAFVHMVVSVTP